MIRISHLNRKFPFCCTQYIFRVSNLHVHKTSRLSYVQPTSQDIAFTHTYTSEDISICSSPQCNRKDNWKYKPPEEKVPNLSHTFVVFRFLPKETTHFLALGELNAIRRHNKSFLLAKLHIRNGQAYACNWEKDRIANIGTSMGKGP